MSQKGSTTRRTTRGTPKDVAFKAATRLHRAVFRLSRGRLFGRALGMPVVELITTGRTSGKERTTMLTAPVLEEDRVVLIASFGGDDRDPAWLLNLRAHPTVRLTAAGRTRTMIARVLSGDERDALWSEVSSAFPVYANYQKRTERTIPVVVLTPADRSASRAT